MAFQVLESHRTSPLVFGELIREKVFNYPTPGKGNIFLFVNCYCYDDMTFENKAMYFRNYCQKYTFFNYPLIRCVEMPSFVQSLLNNVSMGYIFTFEGFTSFWNSVQL